MTEVYPYQQALWDKLQEGGTTAGEVIIYKARRSTGKSMFYVHAHNNFLTRKITMIAKAMVDDAMWYTVRVSSPAGQWMRGQPKEMWYEHPSSNWPIDANTFDMHEKLYTMLALAWSES